MSCLLRRRRGRAGGVEAEDGGSWGVGCGQQQGTNTKRFFAEKFVQGEYR